MRHAAIFLALSSGFLLAGCPQNCPLVPCNTTLNIEYENWPTAFYGKTLVYTITDNGREVRFKCALKPDAIDNDATCHDGNYTYDVSDEGVRLVMGPGDNYELHIADDETGEVYMDYAVEPRWEPTPNGCCYENEIVTTYF